MAGVIDTKTSCATLKTPEQKQFCEQNVQEQCVEKADDLCIEMFPEDSKAFWKCYQDMMSGKALENQTRRFAVELATVKGKQFKAKDLKGCADVIAKNVAQSGAPKTQPVQKEQAKKIEKRTEKKAEQKAPPSVSGGKIDVMKGKMSEATKAKVRAMLEAQKKSKKQQKPVPAAPPPAPQTQKNDAAKKAQEKVAKLQQAQKAAAMKNAEEKTPQAPQLEPLTKKEADKIAKSPAKGMPRAIAVPKDNAKTHKIEPVGVPDLAKNIKAAALTGDKKEAKIAAYEDVGVTGDSAASAGEKGFISKFFKNYVFDQKTVNKIAEIAKKRGAGEKGKLFLKVRLERTPKAQDGPVKAQIYFKSGGRAPKSGDFEGMNAGCAQEIMAALPERIQMKFDKQTTRMVFVRSSGGALEERDVTGLSATLPLPKMKKK